MEKEKRLNYYDRVHDPEWSKIDFGTTDSDYMYDVNVPTTELVNGVLHTTNVLKDIDVRKNFDGVNWFDFSIDSLAVTGNLQKVSVSGLQLDKFDAADRIDNIDVSVVNQDNNVSDDKNI